MRNIRYRAALPIVFGGLAAVLIAWDIHNTHVIESMGMAWDTGAPIWPYRGSFLILFTVNFPAFVFAAPLFLLDQLQTYPRRIMILPLIALWWWWIGTRIDFGILGRRRYRHPKATAGILVALAAGLLSWAIYTGVTEFQFWKEYGLELRANYLVLLSGTTIPIVSWCLVLSGGALKGARRLYSNR
jgi:hypothetical protein